MIVSDLQRVNLMRADETPLHCSQHTIACAYVIPDFNCTPARRTILDWLAEIGIRSIGRYGAWRYDSMEGALLEGLETATALNTPSQPKQRA